jgi:signal transduction histidine kinase
MSTAILQESLLADEGAGLARAYAESQAFVSLLAHELRTRLKVTERALSSPREDDVDTALANTRTLQELVETLLELARGQTVDSADADAAVRRVLDELREDIELLETDILAGTLPLVPMPQRCSRPSSTTCSQTRSKRALRPSRSSRGPTARSASPTTGPASRPSGRPRSSASTPTSSAARVSG